MQARARASRLHVLIHSASDSYKIIHISENSFIQSESFTTLWTTGQYKNTWNQQHYPIYE